jgi:hypothetical protein
MTPRPWCLVDKPECPGQSCGLARICDMLEDVGKFLVAHEFSEIELKRNGSVIQVARTIKERVMFR